METTELIRAALIRGTRRPSMLGQSGTSRRRGEGYEFAELRAYVSGDDPRRIDWAATARAGALQSRVVLEEHALVLAAVVDTSASMSLGRTRARSADAAEALGWWYGAARHGDRCVRIGSGDVISPAGASGRLAARICVEHATAVADLESALRNAIAALTRGSAILVISDCFATLDDATLHTLGARHDATLLFARDPWHNDFPLRGIVRLRDANTGRSGRYTFDTAARTRYYAAAARREADVRERFRLAGWRVGVLDRDPQHDLRDAFLRGAA